jgi:hypothetical protein
MDRGRIARVHTLGIWIGRGSGLRINLFVFERYQFFVQKLLDKLVAFFLLASLEILVGLKDLVASLIVLSVHNDFELVRSEAGLWLSVGGSMVIVMIACRWVHLVSAHHRWDCILWQLVIRLPQLLLSMRVGAVLAKLALALLHPELAQLGLVIVILHIHHFENQLCWQRLYK